jgi:hypothetical protein
VSGAQVAASCETCKPKNADILEWLLIGLAGPPSRAASPRELPINGGCRLGTSFPTDSLVEPMPLQISPVGHLDYPEYDLDFLGEIHLRCLNDLLLWLPPYKGIERVGLHGMYSVTYAVLGLYHEGV